MDRQEDQCTETRYILSITALIAGIACLWIVLLDAFETIILPRRASGRFRLTRIFYILTWTPWRFLVLRIGNNRKRESALSFYGPFSLILLLGVWAEHGGGFWIHLLCNGQSVS